MAGLLTTLPVLCFGAFAPDRAPPGAADRPGDGGRALAACCSPRASRCGCCRPSPCCSPGSLLVGAAIALANVLMPAYVKREFRRPGAVMGLYSAALNIGAAAGAALTIPLAGALGVDWRWALGLWLVLALVALALWLPVAGTGHAHRTSEPMPEGQGSWSLLRQPLARQVTAYLGLQSVQFYSLAAWLPTLLADAGVPVSRGRPAPRAGQRRRRRRGTAGAGAGRPDAHPAPADPRRRAGLRRRARRPAPLAGRRHARLGRRVRPGAGQRVRPRPDPDRAAQSHPARRRAAGWRRAVPGLPAGGARPAGARRAARPDRRLVLADGPAARARWCR